MNNKGTTVGNFTFWRSELDGVFLIEPKVFEDSRGYFLETYVDRCYVKAGICSDFVQDNQSASKKGTLRGLHYQISHQQAKLVSVLVGEVFDVAVDLRKGSNTYGCWEGVTLSSENHKQLYIPRGFAHGFLVLSDYAVFSYKCDDYYTPGDEGGILWSDPSISIEWPPLNGDSEFDSNKLVLSDKDAQHPTLKESRVVL